MWQEKVRIIAMVTNIKEGMTKKCEQYWPEGGSGKSYGPFNVSIVEQHIFADYTIRTIQLVVSKLLALQLEVTQRSWQLSMLQLLNGMLNDI